MDPYFAEMIANLRAVDGKSGRAAVQARYENIVNPFTLMCLSDHVYSEEHVVHNMVLPDLDRQNWLLRTDDVSCVRELDVVYVDVTLLERFCKEVLDRLPVRVVLATGRWYLPRVERSALGDALLVHPKVALWVSQNPVYPESPRYMAFPYGVSPETMGGYARALLDLHAAPKTRDVVMLPIRHDTHPSRARLPMAPKLSPDEFYAHLASARFVVSPAGDRDDCYRHYEAIGLGTVPLANVDPLYSAIFGESMHIVGTDELVAIAHALGSDPPLTYCEPRRELVCAAYHAERLRAAVKLLAESSP